MLLGYLIYEDECIHKLLDWFGKDVILIRYMVFFRLVFILVEVTLDRERSEDLIGDSYHIDSKSLPAIDPATPTQLTMPPSEAPRAV